MQRLRIPAQIAIGSMRLLFSGHLNVSIRYRSGREEALKAENLEPRRSKINYPVA